MKTYRLKILRASLSRPLLLAGLALMAAGFWLWRAPARAAAPPPVRRVNAPYFAGDVTYEERAIFWFGQVNSTDNYADVRVGYNDDKLVLQLTTFDRRLWYDADPPIEDLTAWDAATLYLNLAGNSGEVPSASTYRLVGQLNHWQARDDYQAAYQGNGAGWVTASLPFTTATGWRGDGLNGNQEARGWRVTFEVPFSSVGLAGPPAHGTVWGLALVLHDRDDAAGAPNPNKTWPEAVDPLRPASYGQLVFGLPAYQPSLATPGETVTVRHGLNGASVPDGHVGGNTECGKGLDFWTEWGVANYAGADKINVQNQFDVADWPCFSKYYVTFPLDDLPAGKVIISATLTLHQFGNAGAPGEAEPSLIQVLTVAEDWNESTLTWNNAPLAVENVAGTWVDPLDSFPGWPGVPANWDVARAVAAAYAAGQPLRLAVYSADSARHSGKYFVSSDTGDWNASGRPTLQVLWGDAVAEKARVYLPLVLGQ